MWTADVKTIIVYKFNSLLYDYYYGPHDNMQSVRMFFIAGFQMYKNSQLYIFNML